VLFLCCLPYRFAAFLCHLLFCCRPFRLRVLWRRFIYLPLFCIDAGRCDAGIAVLPAYPHYHTLHQHHRDMARHALIHSCHSSVPTMSLGLTRRFGSYAVHWRSAGAAVPLQRADALRTSCHHYRVLRCGTFCCGAANAARRQHRCRCATGAAPFSSGDRLCWAPLPSPSACFCCL